MAVTLKVDDPAHLLGLFDEVHDAMSDAGAGKRGSPGSPSDASLPASPTPAVKSAPTALPIQVGGPLALPRLAADPTGRFGLAPMTFGNVNAVQQPMQPHRGFGGEVKHILGQVGEIAGSALVPNLMPWIPGTTQNRMMRSALESKGREQEAELGLTKAKTEQAEATAEHERELAGRETGTPGKGADIIETGQGLMQWNPDTKRYDIFAGPSKESKPAASHFETRWIQGPDGKPQAANFNSGTGKYTDLAGNEIQNPVPVEKAPGAEKPTSGMVGGKPTFALYDPEKGWIDSETKQSIPNFQPPPNFAETGMFEPQVVIAPSGQPQTMVFNKRTGRMEPAQVPGGGTMLAPGAIGGQQYQANVINNAGDALIEEIGANKGKFGNMQAIFNSAFLRTPIADPTSARLAAELASFAALQPKLHGFRGQQAMDEFERMIGGLPKNPDALIESIRGIQNTAGMVEGSPRQRGSAAAAGSVPTGATKRAKGSDGKWHYTNDRGEDLGAIP